MLGCCVCSISAVGVCLFEHEMVPRYGFPDRVPAPTQSTGATTPNRCAGNAMDKGEAAESSQTQRDSGKRETENEVELLAAVPATRDDGTHEAVEALASESFPDFLFQQYESVVKDVGSPAGPLGSAPVRPLGRDLVSLVFSRRNMVGPQQCSDLDEVVVISVVDSCLDERVAAFVGDAVADAWTNASTLAPDSTTAIVGAITVAVRTCALQLLRALVLSEFPDDRHSGSSIPGSPVSAPPHNVPVGTASPGGSRPASPPLVAESAAPSTSKLQAIFPTTTTTKQTAPAAHGTRINSPPPSPTSVRERHNVSPSSRTGAGGSVGVVLPRMTQRNWCSCIAVPIDLLGQCVEARLRYMKKEMQAAKVAESKSKRHGTANRQSRSTGSTGGGSAVRTTCGCLPFFGWRRINNSHSSSVVEKTHTVTTVAASGVSESKASSRMRGSDGFGGGKDDRELAMQGRGEEEKEEQEDLRTVLRRVARSSMLVPIAHGGSQVGDAVGTCSADAVMLSEQCPFVTEAVVEQLLNFLVEQFPVCIEASKRGQGDVPWRPTMLPNLLRTTAGSPKTHCALRVTVLSSLMLVAVVHVPSKEAIHHTEEIEAARLTAAAISALERQDSDISLPSASVTETGLELLTDIWMQEIRWLDVTTLIRSLPTATTTTTTSPSSSSSFSPPLAASSSSLPPKQLSPRRSPQQSQPNSPPKSLTYV